MNTFCRKGDLIRLFTPTISAWQGIGIAAETVYDDGDPDTMVPFYKPDQPLDDEVPSIALIGEVEVVVSTARSLIQRLADAREAEQAFGPMPDARDSLLEEARAFLVQPVDLSHLSDDEHNALCPQGYHATGDAASTVAETPTNCIYFNTTSTEEVMRLDNRGLHYKGQFIADAGEAHQLLLAWLRRNSGGSHALEPIPLAERLPTEADCDAEGLCWFWHSDHKEDEFGDGWMLLKPEWADGLHDSDDSPVYTHWLPYWALPVPGVEA